MNQHTNFFSQVPEEKYMGLIVGLIFKPEQETYKVGDNNLLNIDIYRKHESIMLSVSHLELRHNTSTSSTVEVKIELKNEDSCTSVLFSLHTHMQLPVFITMEAIELEQETSIRTKIEDLALYFSGWSDQTKRIVKKWLMNYLAKGLYELSSVKLCAKDHTFKEYHDLMMMSQKYSVARHTGFQNQYPLPPNPYFYRHPLDPRSALQQAPGPIYPTQPMHPFHRAPSVFGNQFPGTDFTTENPPWPYPMSSQTQESERKEESNSVSNY